MAWDTSQSPRPGPPVVVRCRIRASKALSTSMVKAVQANDNRAGSGSRGAGLLFCMAVASPILQKDSERRPTT